MSLNSFLVVNATNPELNHLAARLASQQRLMRFFRVYANRDRRLERHLGAVPGVGALYARTFGRRRLLPGLLGDRVREAGLIEDFALAALARCKGSPKSLSDRLTLRMAAQIGRAAAKEAGPADAVVGSYYVALWAFRAARGLKILNYPNVHRDFFRSFVAEEAEREPEFAETLPDWKREPAWVEEQLDEECHLADRILVGSSFARDAFISAGIPKAKLVVSAYGADLGRFSPGVEGVESRPSKFTIMFAGQIGQRKGIAYLLRAYERFRSSDTELVLVGNFYGSDQPFRKYSHLFRHIPNVPQSELVQLYRRADVFVFPTLIEGMGLTALEAMASGVPVITTPNGPGDFVRDGIDGYTVPIRDVDAIVDRLERMRSDRELREQMGKNARVRALEFSWEAYATRTLEAIDQLAN